MYVWACLGVLLIAAEVLTTSFVLLFFGISALLVSALCYFGLENLNIQIGLFIAFALGMIFAFRQKLRAAFESRAAWQGEQKFTASTSISPNSEALLQYQGAPWTAFNESNDMIAAGTQVKVVRKDGNKLYVTKA